MSRKERRKAAAAARQMPPVCQAPALPETQAPVAVPARATEPDLRQSYLDKFQPADAVELSLIEEMINAESRQRCLARVEENAFSHIMSAAPDAVTAAFEERAKLLASLDRTRKAYAQQFSRALATLIKLRAMNRPAKKQASPAQPDSHVMPAPAPEPSEPASQTQSGDASEPSAPPLNIAPDAPAQSALRAPQSPQPPYSKILGNNGLECYTEETAFSG